MGVDAIDQTICAGNDQFGQLLVTPSTEGQIVWSIASTPIKKLFYFLIKQKQGSGHDLNIFMHILWKYG